MNFRTDLAIESIQSKKGSINISSDEYKFGDVTVSRVLIDNQEISDKLGKPLGKYVTVEMPTLTEYFRASDERIKIISDEIKNLIPKEGLAFVIGLGNLEITPDALGPKATNSILATRHISGEISKSLGLENLRPVSVLSPGVLGQTGIEAVELISSIVKDLKPSCVIVIDALASRSLSRLGCTVQISDSGISPGAGVGNKRPLINEETLGVPVIGIGTPTVVDASTLANDILYEHTKDSRNKKDISYPNAETMIVTPREIDLLIKRASLLIGMSINCALHPDFSPDDLQSLVS